jgi:hypothetical protein
MIQVSCKLFAHMNELETTHAGSSAGSKAGAICERALKPCVPVSLCPCTILSVTLIWLGSNSTCLVRWGQTTQMVVLELLAFQPSRHGLAAFEHGNWQYLEECLHSDEISNPKQMLLCSICRAATFFSEFQRTWESTNGFTSTKPLTMTPEQIDLFTPRLLQVQHSARWDQHEIKAHASSQPWQVHFENMLDAGPKRSFESSNTFGC